MMLMKIHNKSIWGKTALVVVMLALPAGAWADDKADAIADALSAAWPGMAESAKVVDWSGNVLREGTNGYTCMPATDSAAPMCMDDAWMAWADAWMNKKEYATKTLGISYMLAGDGPGASNIDPYAKGPTDENQWTVDGAHLMILAPAALLESYPTDPNNGGPYVMWKGTPYQHLMVPIGPRD